MTFREGEKEFVLHGLLPVAGDSFSQNPDPIRHLLHPISLSFLYNYYVKLPFLDITAKFPLELVRF